uniref:Uncharacterized protein n=1 Tax=Triticum urartu TaxID=4572 RepID=A0A8R7P4C9_TRIUA
MGNARSKAGEHEQEDDKATGSTSIKNDEEYNANLIPVDEKVDAICATEPAPTSDTTLKDGNPSIITIAADVEPFYTTETDGPERVRPGYHDDGQTFALTASLTLDHAIHNMQL